MWMSGYFEGSQILSCILPCLLLYSSVSKYSIWEEYYKRCGYWWWRFYSHFQDPYAMCLSQGIQPLLWLCHSNPSSLQLPSPWVTHFPWESSATLISLVSQQRITPMSARWLETNNFKGEQSEEKKVDIDWPPDWIWAIWVFSSTLFSHINVKNLIALTVNQKSPLTV